MIGIKPLEMKAVKTRKSNPTNCELYETRIIASEGELIKCLNEGWDLIKEISGGRFVIRRCLWMDSPAYIISAFATALFSILSAILILYVREWMNKKKLLRSLYSEMKANLALAKKILPHARSLSSPRQRGESTIFNLQRLYTHSYQYVRHSGYLLSLAEDIRRLLNETYELIFAHNIQTDINIYSPVFLPSTLIPSPPRTRGYCERLEEIIRNLENLIERFSHIIR